jgi:hypothetical protein
MKFSDLVIDNAVQFGSASSGHMHNFLPHDLVEEIDRYYDEENTRLAMEYFNRNGLFPSHTSAAEHEQVSVDSLSTTDLIGFFGGLLVRYDERLSVLEKRVAKQVALEKKQQSMSTD